MDTDRREQIRRSLTQLADSYRATMEVMEATLALLCEELSLDPLAYLRSRTPPPRGDDPAGLVIDPGLLTVHFRGRACFLGNTLPFHLLTRLARRPNTYVSYEDLLTEVWDGGLRSDTAVRSVVKTLRQKLRDAGLAELAAAIDGTSRGHYALRLPG